jgi:hypothetical protein
MGWWSAGAHGGISGVLDEPSETEREEYWGDSPADIMDDALARIVAEFEEAWGRKPYRSEIEKGLQFSLGIYKE